MKKLLFLLVFLSLHSLVFAQNEAVSLLKGKRWALAHLVEEFGNKKDTLLRVHDCTNEFVEFLIDGTFTIPTLEKDGKWTVEQDSILIFRNHRGGKIKTAYIRYLSKDSLLLVDKVRNTKSSIFYESYNLCRIGDSTYVDNDREEFQTQKNMGVVAGFQQFDNSVVEIGFGKGKIEWDNHFYGYSLNLNLAPWNKVYGLHLNAWSDGTWFSYGLGTTLQSDSEKLYFGLKPMFGLSGRQLFGKSSHSAHLVYSYDVLLGGVSSTLKNSSINRHSITLRFYLAFKRSFQVMRVKK